MKKRSLAPPGTLRHELLSLLPFWRTVFTRKTEAMFEQKHKYGNNWRQYFLLFLPKDNVIQQDKIIIYFHGGGWSLGKPEYFRAHAWQFVQRGYAVIMPSHRRIPRFSHLDMREDLMLLLKTLEKVFSKYDWKQQSIIMGGTSSGGTLAAHLVYDSTIESELKKRLHAFFLLSAPLDLSKMSQTPVLLSYMGKQAKEANLMSHCPHHWALPTLLVHGRKDAIVDYTSSISFVQQLYANQCTNVTFHTLPNGIHLDASRWGYEDSEVRQVLFEWLKEVGRTA
jgi:acetyl esterase/lipase